MDLFIKISDCCNSY